MYEWVQVEAEDPEYQSIDDVVACRKDGRIELTQVKFTPDPQDPDKRLSWEWLTRRKPNGTSLLQKWSTTVLEYGDDERLAHAKLKTDRKPNLEFSQCLDGSRVDYRRLPSKIKETVDAQIGSEEADAFFESFEFVHSQLRYDDYEESLRSELEYDIDKNGWAYFRQEVRHWAMRKNAPLPDGKIRHFHLRRAFAPERPVVLSQDFSVPPNYKVPDSAFHQEFIYKAANSDGVTVLWGPPGRGKSTYLSHCVSKLAAQDDVLCIRHHYFLRLDEQGDRRFSYFAIERSLIQQMVGAGVSKSGKNINLAEALAAAASEMCQSGRRLVVVIDGLDHVWRDHRDLEQMELLFDSLLPLPVGVQLLVGTQRVDDEHLPKKLLRAQPKERWTELPTMSITAVQEWLKSHVAGGRLQVEEIQFKPEKEIIDELGLALHDISAGLPLHLVYSLEALLKSGEPVTARAVRQLPECPSGEIEDYYESLWVGLSSGARRALHLLAGLKFSPPSFGLGKCLTADVIWWQALEEIGHLLDCREASVVPFHGSLFAFLRDRSDHIQAFRSLAVNVLNWLERESPEYWRRAWLWVMRADLGDSKDLLEGPSREWAIHWLVSGYPVDQLVFILSQAEEVALDTFDLPRLIRLRCLKTRAVNARKFQTNDWGTFYETSLALSRDQNLGAVLWDNLPKLETEELPAVSSLIRGVPANAGRQAIRELERRRTSWISSGDRDIWDTYADAIIRMVARQPEDRADRVIAFAENLGVESLIDLYMTEALKAGNYQKVLAMGSRRNSHELDRTTFAALCLEGIGPSAGFDLVSADRPAFGCLAF
ncbi:MAG: NACHT domain-containing protein, partial [Gammaproteobacteria bacterium]|nr:NACHT domain-containing protein [Gammaproteobacteria bacterium]